MDLDLDPWHREYGNRMLPVFSPLSRLPVQTVAIFGYLEPLSAVAFSALLLGEEMTLIQIIGAGLIIGGAMVGELRK